VAIRMEPSQLKTVHFRVNCAVHHNMTVLYLKQSLRQRHLAIGTALHNVAEASRVKSFFIDVVRNVALIVRIFKASSPNEIWATLLQIFNRQTKRTLLRERRFTMRIAHFHLRKKILFSKTFTGTFCRVSSVD
jgi:hypothetical protein